MFERDGTIDGVFAQRAAEVPEAIAVCGTGRSVTYAELDRTANRVANALIAAGVRPGATVGVAFERSIRLPGTLIGISGRGAAYVPLDASYPAERLKSWLPTPAWRMCWWTPLAIFGRESVSRP